LRSTSTLAFSRRRFVEALTSNRARMIPDPGAVLKKEGVSPAYSVCCPGIATGGVGIGPQSSVAGTMVGSVELSISSQVTALPV
jgi:hypothetical protein